MYGFEEGWNMENRDTVQQRLPFVILNMGGMW